VTSSAISFSAGLLYFATFLIGVCWIEAQRRAASAEFGRDSRLRTNWLIASVLLFLALVSAAWASGQSEWLSDFERFPPPFAIFFVWIWAAAAYCGFSRFGSALVKHTPMHLLIAFQSFRLLAEWAIYVGVSEGIAPVQLSFHGYNWDILTAISAPFVALHARKNPASKAIVAWNCMGLAFLLIIAFIAVTSMPTPLRLFMSEPTNIWVTKVPHILLPGVLVPAAIAGHMLIFRKYLYMTRIPSEKSGP
jgi:hypothetical protein